MDLEDFRLVQVAAAPYEVQPEPEEGEVLQFVTIEIGSDPAALLCKRLGRAGLLYDDSLPKDASDGPALAPYTSDGQSITFIDKNVIREEEKEPDFSHLDAQEREFIETLKGLDDTQGIIRAFNNAGISQVKLSNMVGLSRPTIAQTLATTDIRRPGSERGLMAARAVKNTFLDLVGYEQFPVNKAILTLTEYYLEGSIDRLEHPFQLSDDIRRMVDKLWSVRNIEAHRSIDRGQAQAD